MLVGRPKSPSVSSSIVGLRWLLSVPLKVPQYSRLGWRTHNGDVLLQRQTDFLHLVSPRWVLISKLSVEPEFEISCGACGDHVMGRPRTVVSFFGAVFEVRFHSSLRDWLRSSSICWWYHRVDAGTRGLAVIFMLGFNSLFDDHVEFDALEDRFLRRVSGRAQFPNMRNGRRLHCCRGAEAAAQREKPESRGSLSRATSRKSGHYGGRCQRGLHLCELLRSRNLSVVPSFRRN